MGMGGGPAGELRTYPMRRATRSVAGRLQIVGGWGYALGIAVSEHTARSDAFVLQKCDECAT
jgi:hypothetical protein